MESLFIWASIVVVLQLSWTWSVVSEEQSEVSEVVVSNDTDQWCSEVSWVASNDGRRFYHYVIDKKLSLDGARQVCRQCPGGDLATLGQDGPHVGPDVEIWQTLVYQYGNTGGSRVREAWVGYKTDYDTWKVVGGGELPDGEVKTTLDNLCKTSNQNIETQCRNGVQSRFNYVKRLYSDVAFFHVVGTERRTETKNFLCERSDATVTPASNLTGPIYTLAFNFEKLLEENIDKENSGPNQAPRKMTTATPDLHIGRDKARLHWVTIPSLIALIIIIGLFLLGCKMRHDDF